MAPTIHYGQDHITARNAIDICTNQVKALISAQALEKIVASHNHVTNIVHKKKVVYGINTGFGALASTIISSKDTTILQKKILQSHSVGVGAAIPAHIVRLMMTQRCTHWHKDIVESILIPCNVSYGF